jgi:hypothetical protein
MFAINAQDADSMRKLTLKLLTIELIGSAIIIGAIALFS